MRRRVLFTALLALTLCRPEAARGFCGFYVASGEAKLFNRTSQVVLVRDGDRTVMTICSDYEGDPREFALVVPVPTVLKRGQIHVADPALIGRLDRYSAPRLVEYRDEDPCPLEGVKLMAESPVLSIREITVGTRGGRRSDVRIEARYQVDEYDVLILSADESGGLLRWLNARGYRVPEAAEAVVASYLMQGMKFFVAKVDLRQRAERGVLQLRPLQIAYESPKFVLPVRLGMTNAQGPQDLIVYAITRRGRVEAVNYRNARLPEAVEVPAFVKADFANTWRDAFAEQVKREGLGVVFTEYSWPASRCDPCPGTPPTNEELRTLGAWWLDDQRWDESHFTRLHARYDRASFPEDLQLQVTADVAPFQSRVIVRHEWTGEATCDAARRYRAGLPARRERDARALAQLTGCSLGTVRERMQVDAAWMHPGEKDALERQAAWWERLWKN